MQERQGRNDQGVGVDLGGSGEDHAVAVDQVDGAFGLDHALDGGRGEAGVVDAVQRDPLVGAVGLGALGLVEVDSGVLADVEAVPGEDGLGGGLIDGDQGLAVSAEHLGGGVGVEPQRGVGGDGAGGDEAPGDQAVGDHGGFGQGRGAGGRLGLVGQVHGGGDAGLDGGLAGQGRLGGGRQGGDRDARSGRSAAGPGRGSAHARDGLGGGRLGGQQGRQAGAGQQQTARAQGRKLGRGKLGHGTFPVGRVGAGGARRHRVDLPARKGLVVAVEAGRQGVAAWPKLGPRRWAVAAWLKVPTRVGVSA